MDYGGRILVKVIYDIKSTGLHTLNFGMGMLMPFLLYGAGIFGADKEKLRRIYIDTNNKSADFRLQHKLPTKTLLLLPHCMQNKNCSRSISEDIKNCRRCGSCKIGEAADAALKRGIMAAVAKGGTAARNTVKEYKPDFIIAVACERELVSGIGDVGRIPVIGVINERPDGYCTNTAVDMHELSGILQKFSVRGIEDTALPIAHDPYN